jgi:hypothetical protein
MKKRIGLCAVVVALGASALAWSAREPERVSLEALNAEIDGRAHARLQTLIRERAQLSARASSAVHLASR